MTPLSDGHFVFVPAFFSHITINNNRRTTDTWGALFQGKYFKQKCRKWPWKCHVQLLHFRFEVFPLKLKKRSSSDRNPIIINYSNMTEKGRNEHEVSVFKRELTVFYFIIPCLSLHVSLLHVWSLHVLLPHVWSLHVFYSMFDHSMFYHSMFYYSIFYHSMFYHASPCFTTLVHSMFYLCRVLSFAIVS